MIAISSWDAATWIWASLWCMMILLGIFMLLGIRRQGGAAERKHDLFSGPFFIGIGLFQLVTFRPDPGRAAFDIGFGVFMVAAGLWVVLFGSYFAALRRRSYEVRLANRLARGEDAYFEELRELEAYPPQPAASPSLEQYAFGALYVILGGALIAVNINR